MDKDFNLKKSQLRNGQAKELKRIEKDLKKKKGYQREALTNAIDEAMKKHEREIEELEKEYGVSAASKKEPKSRSTCYFPDRNWKDLGGKELEIEAAKRGLGKKGSREELLTKLIIFHTEQNKLVADGLIDINNVYREEKQPIGGLKDADSEEVDDDSDDGGQERIAPIASSANSSKRTDIASSATANRLKKNTKSSSSDTDSSDSESSGSEKNADIPDSLRERGRGGDLRGSQKRSAQQKYKPDHHRGTKSHNHRNNNKQISETQVTEAERQAKRETVMAQVLVKLLQKKPEGLPISEIPVELQQLKVTNFHPSLLGYDTMEEWLINQGPDIVHFDTKKKRIMPGRKRSLPHMDE